jgi:membrane protein DedA with SNARE-associated domain
VLRKLLGWPLVASLAETEDTVLTPVGVILWWEKRRCLYNGLLATAGLVSIVVVFVFGAVVGTECGICDPPIVLFFVAVAYAFGANVCYTFGYLAEFVARSTSFNEKSRKFGASFFALGTICSIALTLAPAVLIPFLCSVGRLATGHW